MVICHLLLVIVLRVVNSPKITKTFSVTGIVKFYSQQHLKSQLKFGRILSRSIDNSYWISNLFSVKEQN